MNKNRLTIASVLLLGLIALTVVMVNARKADYAPAATATITLPKVDEAKVDELVLSGADQPKTRLVKQGEEWRMAEPVDAKADQEAVKQAVKKLGELKATGVAATKKENHEQLEVTDAKATHVIAKSGGKPVFDGYLGSYDSGQTMVRLEGQEPVAAVEGSIRYAFRKPPKDFRDKTISKFETVHAQKIAFDNKHGHFEFVRKGGDVWEQVLAKGQKRINPLDIPKVRGILGSASGLNATDFAAPGVTPEQAGLTADAAKATFYLEVGDQGPSQVVLRVGNQVENGYYLQKEGVDTIYVVSNWLGSRFSPKADDLTKKDPPKAPPPSAAAPAPQGAQGQIDPAILEQLQRQLGNNPHAPH